MKKICKIDYMGSISGNAGCNNGCYDAAWSVHFDNGEVWQCQTCACGCGCSNTEPVALLKVGMSEDDALAILEDD